MANRDWYKLIRNSSINYAEIVDIFSKVNYSLLSDSCRNRENSMLWKQSSESNRFLNFLKIDKCKSESNFLQKKKKIMIWFFISFFIIFLFFYFFSNCQLYHLSFQFHHLFYYYFIIFIFCLFMLFFLVFIAFFQIKWPKNLI